MKKSRAEKLTPERVIKILKTKKNNISRDEALTILKFVDNIAKIAVDQYLRKK
jgi:hypothetical protein